MNASRSKHKKANYKFYTQIDRYNELYEDVENFETTFIIKGWLSVDICPLKYAFLNHISKWSNLYKQWLLKHVIVTLKVTRLHNV